MVTSLPTPTRGYAPPMHPLRSVALKLVGSPWLPKVSPVVAGVDRGLRMVSSGHVTVASVTGLPELLLTVRSLHSGEPSTTPVLCTPYRGGWVVVGTTWGAPEYPTWAESLRAVAQAGGTAVVEFRALSYVVDPQELTGPDLAAAWDAALATWPHYSRYQQQAHHPLPVWHLTPRTP